MIGAVLALGLRRLGTSLPRIPEGDTVVAAEAGFRASFALGAFFESPDAAAPVAGRRPDASNDCPGSGGDGRGPFPPPELPGFRGTTNLSATPERPACPSRASGWSCHLRPNHALGLPVLR